MQRRVEFVLTSEEFITVSSKVSTQRQAVSHLANRISHGQEYTQDELVSMLNNIAEGLRCAESALQCNDEGSQVEA